MDQPTAMDTGTETLRYPFTWLWRVRFGMLAAAVLAGFAVYSAIFELPADPVQVRWLAGILVGAAAALVALIGYHRVVSYGLAVTPEGVTQTRGGAIVHEFRWREIDRARLRRILGRLELSSSQGRGRITVDNHLEGFAWLIEEVPRRTGRDIDRTVF